MVNHARKLILHFFFSPKFSTLNLLCPDQIIAGRQSPTKNVVLHPTIIQQSPNTHYNAQSTTRNNVSLFALNPVILLTPYTIGLYVPLFTGKSLNLGQPTADPFIQPSGGFKNFTHKHLVWTRVWIPHVSPALTLPPSLLTPRGPFRRKTIQAQERIDQLK